MAKWFPEPSTRDDTYARSCEETLYWLKRSTLPLAVDYRDFLNRNLSMLPKSCREGIYNHLRNERHYQDGFFELIVGRTLQEMGASIECEPATISVSTTSSCSPRSSPSSRTATEITSP